ncbi:MAG: DEAD/DEAH box helicase [Planctomycetota bacterium]
MPARADAGITLQATELWCDRLIEAGEASNREEAKLWIDELQANNPDYHKQRLAAHSKKVRDELSMDGHSLSLLHPSSSEILKRIAAQGIGALILDECHHLVGHWGRVLSSAYELLGQPVVIGLTATPPGLDNKEPKDVERYQSFFGPIDYEVPVPAIVKDGYLSPYQDLAWFVRPSAEELKFVASADQQLDALIERLCCPESGVSKNEIDSEIDGDGQEPGISNEQEAGTQKLTGQEAGKVHPLNLVDWIAQTLSELRFPNARFDRWSAFEKRDPAFSLAARRFLNRQGAGLPNGVPDLNAAELPGDLPELEYWVPVLDRYVRHYLRRSPDSSLQRLGDDVVRTLRTLGIQITEAGTRACASPVSRVLAYSSNKATALIPVLMQEMDNLGDTIRAVVVTDFERSSAVTAELKGLMDSETGGAIAAFKTLLSDPKTDELEPVLVTGSTVLIDDEIEAEFLQQCRQWLEERELMVELSSEAVLNFRQIHGAGRDWSPRVYIEMITDLFQQGLTRCLIGTRGLLGEGWDANKINVLVDLTTVTTSMSINQLRGRSFRLDPEWKTKIANNWDIVCIAPEFKKGFDDYSRFIRKHRSLYGVTDDGAIEKGVGHVHPAFTEIQPEGLESSAGVFNDEMLKRSSRRKRARQLWQIGKPYQSVPVRAVEAKLPSGNGGFPPFGGSNVEWTSRSLTRAISEAVIASLIEAELINSPGVSIHDGELAGGYVRVFIENASPAENKIFATSMKEVLGPLTGPRYIIERSIETRQETFLSRMLPEIVGRYFRKSSFSVAMIHAVPSALGRNKKLVAIFEKYWNEFVSPGEAVFAQRGAGRELLEQAVNEQANAVSRLHEKEVFL